MVDIDLPYLRRGLGALTAIDSVLPHEGRAAGFLAEELRALGLEPEWQEIAPGRPNVTATLPLGRAERFLVLSGHHDTVPAVAGWSVDPFTLTEYDGRLFGLGIHNMKAGLACKLAAIRALMQTGVAAGGRGRLGFASVADHEGEGRGALALLATPYGACDAMLHGEHFFGDSGSDYLPSAVTGKLLYHVTVQGKAGHAFRPTESGAINAIDDAARIIAALPNLPRRTDPELGAGTVCTLKVDGGYRQYAVIVPDRCEIVINRLIVPGETVASAVADLEALIAGLDLASTVTIATPPPSYPPYRLDLEHPATVAFRDSYREATGQAPLFAPHTGGMDANIYAGQGGIPTVVFGPKGANHHRPDEYVLARSLEPVARVYAETALRYLDAS